ncbi:MAG: ABC transporter substrate-binding protein [Oscillospiraceae bacterium]|nr:ABC transporter substrate-binding protein [Oscillospiraceae bacterium]
MKIIKQIVAVCMIFVLSAGFAGCEDNNNNLNKNPDDNIDKINYTETLRVYNAGEYIDMTTIADFEKEFAIKIEYSEFESNEDMYSEISKNLNSYDVLVPSDYMIDRLIKEDKLEKLDKDKVPNIINIAEEYLNPVYDSVNDYVAPYMVGTLGILYNKKYATDNINSWTILFDSQYQGKVLMLDSQRDSIGITLKMLGYSLNSGDDNELAQVKSKLNNMRFTYDESEIIRDKMVAGEGVLGVVYSGDAKIAIDRNPDLAYAIPIDGSNKWVDGFVIVKNTQHLAAAQKFINFMCRPNIAVRNMSKIGYTSPVKGAWAEFGGNKIMFPAEEELERCEAFLYDISAAEKYDKLWSEIN